METYGGRKIRFWTKLTFGVGRAAEGIKNTSFTTFLFFYFNQVLGVSGTLCGVAVFIALIFDAVSDPAAGFISDNFRSRWGRRHPFMFFAAIPLAVTFFLLFTPPGNFDEISLFVWLTVFAILVRLSMTFYYIPHSALGAELTTNYQERTSLFSYSTFFGFSGGLGCALIGFNVFFVKTPQFANGLLNARAYPYFALMGSIVMLVTIWISVFGTRREIPYLPPVPQESERFSFSLVAKEMGKALQNPSFRAIFLGYIVISGIEGIRGSLLLHCGIYFWEFTSGEISMFIVVYFFGVVLAAFVSRRFNQWIDKKYTVILGTAGYLVPTTAIYILRILGWFPENGSPALLPVILAFSFFGYFFLVMATITIYSMLADVTDEHELEHHKRQEGIFYSSLAFSQKAASGLGHLFAGLAIDFMHFPKEAAPGAVEEGAITSLGWFQGPITGVVGIFALIFYMGYKLNIQKHGKIMEVLRERRENESAKNGSGEGGN